MKHKIGGLCGVLLWTLMACQSPGILRGSSQEQAFRERYVQKPFYTAVFIHPYRYNEDYLIDLTGTIAELDTETPRAPVALHQRRDEPVIRNKDLLPCLPFALLACQPYSVCLSLAFRFWN